MARPRKSDKQVPKEVLKRSVIEVAPPPPEGGPPISDVSLLWFVAQAADEIPEWGTDVKARDRELRRFMLKESYFMSALGTVVARNMGFDWTLHGPPRVMANQQEMLNHANMGKGWLDFVAKVSIDLYTQDSGAFVEIVRAGENPTPASPIIGLNHLEAARCWHTGNPGEPVLYRDLKEVFHKLAWHQVVTLSELPAPVERLPGIQICALSRMLRAAQVIRNITLYKEEKTGGRFNRALHIVQGITADQINDALSKLNVRADAQGLVRYTQPLVVPTRSKDAKLDLKTLELAALPEGWDEEKMFKMYIAIIAMAFLSDYQDFAPLPGGNLGTSAQSEILHLKTRGKGPALFRKLVTHMLNHEILPKAVEFKYEEQDLGAEKQEADIRKVRAETRAILIKSEELSPEAARQQALDQGDMSQELFDTFGDVDVTPQETIEDEEQAEKGVPAKAGPFRRRVGGGLREDDEEGEEGTVDYW